MKRHKKKKSNTIFKMANRSFKASVIALLVLVLLAVVFHMVLRYTHSAFNASPISAFVQYKDWCELIDDKTYLDDNEISSLENYPTLVFQDGTVTFNIKNYDDFHMDYVYTGDEKFVYSSNDLWDKLIKTGQQYPETNTSHGWVKTMSNSVTLSRDGWYTVFGIWNEDGRKNYIVDCFNRNMHFVSTVNEEAIAAYKRWSKNKNAAKPVDGIENYLLVGADKWSRKTENDVFSDTVIVVTVNHTNHTVSFTSILKETYVYIPGIGAGRITNAYNCGGMELLLQTVRENFGIAINNYFAFDYQFFIGFVDAVGGVEFELNEAEIPHINAYIDSLYEQYSLADRPENHYIESNERIQKLDGVQALSYLRNYYMGDFARAERYKAFLNEMRSKVSLRNFAYLVNEVYPLITTDLIYSDYKNLLFDAQLFEKYDVSYASVPETNRIADFKENGAYSVLLADDEEVQEVVRRVSITGNYHFDPTNLYDILAVCFWTIVALLALFAIYLAFVHKYKVIYICGVRTYTKEKKYRFGKKIHVFHNHLPCKVIGYYADPEMKVELDEDYRMPMKTLLVYVRVQETVSES